jgi:FtsP/CotA-like multicopper oxidase with cupredoxin domain
VHTHLIDFKILDRNGNPPKPYERGPKDVAYVGEHESVRVIARFGPRVGKYMMHCHNLVHEDHDMMTHFEVGTGGPDPSLTAPAMPLPAPPL